ncbi:hypothetical protein H5410_008250 [Solanum commersonii]|uniref:Uncharacterized protein n=1 Tax=Solanum commersonii TaxID=4109 RepID=A0A9J6AEN6_SOLCO|nr:hypothetical protein H5410_008250 [Solanum commersonii]
MEEITTELYARLFSQWLVEGGTTATPHLTRDVLDFKIKLINFQTTQIDSQYEHLECGGLGWYNRNAGKCKSRIPFCKNYGLELRYEVLLQEGHLKKDMLLCQVKTPGRLPRKRNILEANAME